MSPEKIDRLFFDACGSNCPAPLGRFAGNDEAVIGALMGAIASPLHDRTLDHVILYAMIERASPKWIRQYFASEQPRHRWAAMMVLEQTSQITLVDAPFVLLQVASEDQTVATLALEIVTAHPEFAASALEMMNQ